VYRNGLRSTCSGLARDNDIIVSEQFGGQKCRGDFIRCGLGQFIPYRAEKAAD
jgi:hypothetical protein